MCGTMMYSKGLNDFFDDVSKAAIDAWKVAENVEMDYIMNGKNFKEIYGYSRPLEVFDSLTHIEACDRRNAYFKKKENKTALKKKIVSLLNEYDREDILKAIREAGEGK